MSDERCNELYDLRGQADRAIYEISKFLEKPEYADHAMECLFNIAILSSAELNHFRFKEPELLKRFASTRTQWPYWLGHEQEGWVKTRMPKEIREVLYEIGLNSDPAGWPVKPTNDFLGRKIKLWRGNMVDFRRNPDYSPNIVEDLELDETFRDRLMKLPEMDATKKTRRAWAKVIFDIIFQRYWLYSFHNPSGIPPRDLELFQEEGSELVERPEGESALYDKSRFAYSLLRPCSETMMQRRKSENEVLRQQCFDEARDWYLKKVCSKGAEDRGPVSLDELPEEDEAKIRSKAEDLMKRRFDIDPFDPGHPTDKEFREQTVEIITGRLKTFPL